MQQHASFDVPLGGAKSVYVNAKVNCVAFNALSNDWEARFVLDQSSVVDEM